jgi:hypothetical protein
MERHHRAEQHHAAAPALRHAGTKVQALRQHRRAVDGHHVDFVVGTWLEEWPRAAEAGGGDQQTHFQIRRGSSQPGHRVRSTKVQRHDQATDAVAPLQFLSQRFERRRTPRNQHEVQPGRGGLDGKRAADAVGGACDHRPGAEGLQSRCGCAAHDATRISMAHSAASAGIVNTASSKRGARNVGRTLFETPHCSVGMPRKLVSTRWSPLRSWPTDTA